MKKYGSTSSIAASLLHNQLSENFKNIIIMEARTKNISSEDINILLALVKEKASVIECKQTDKTNTSAKDKAWREVEQNFNSVTEGPKRNHKILKTKYFNLKANLKKRTAAEKRSVYGTGGGPPQKQRKESFDDILKDIIPEKQISGLASVYDSDFVVERLDDTEYTYENETQCLDMELSASESVYNQIEAPTTSIRKTQLPWESYDPAMLKTEKNKKLQFPKSENISKTSWTKLSEIKSKWTEIKLKQEVDLFKAEHDLRVAQMVHRHELQERLMLEKHELEMKILEKKLSEN